MSSIYQKLFNQGFSPAQLVFGRNTNLPNLIDNKLPAQEISTLLHIPFDIVAIHAARGAFVDTESTKIKLALWKISGHLESHITSQKSEVCYKRNDNQACKEPTRVLGQGDPVVFI